MHKRSLVVNFGAASPDRPVVGVPAVQVGRGAAEEIHAHRHHAGEVEGHAPAGGGLVQCFARQRAEVLDQEAVAARGQDAAADLVAREFEALEDDGFEAGVDEALGGGRGREARADDDHIYRAHGGNLKVRG